MDRFQNTNKQFYEDLKQGRADKGDFERYIYGSHSKKSYNRDQQDKIDEDVRMDQARMTRSIDDLAR